MKERTQAQRLRLIIDDLERVAAETSAVIKDLPKLEGKTSDLLPKTPDGVRSLISVLKTAYKKAKVDQNTPTTQELRFLETLQPAKAKLDEALATLEEAKKAYQKAMEGHEHRVRLEDPEINKATGKARYPDHPTCVICEEVLEHEWYCAKSPDLRCSYPNVLGQGVGPTIRGTSLKEAGHDGDIECIHCGGTWTRLASS